MLRSFLKCVFCLLPSLLFASSDVISNNKKDVLHQFVRFDPPTDHFTQYVFQNWENETFDVFEEVKDKESIAIDLGAWIGTTAIWLSKNFHHVIAVEPDSRSIECLRQNLAASDCPNVSICERPVSNSSHKVIFGPQGAELNQSISCIKNRADNAKEYAVKSITFKQLLYDYIFANDDLRNRRVSFIKCDIEGGEENILEDVLHFAYNNKCKVYMSFHLGWWKSKKITDFEHLFKHFKTPIPGNDVCAYLTNNPFGSVLLEPVDV